MTTQTLRAAQDTQTRYRGVLAVRGKAVHPVERF